MCARVCVCVSFIDPQLWIFRQLFSETKVFTKMGVYVHTMGGGGPKPPQPTPHPPTYPSGKHALCDRKPAAQCDRVRVLQSACLLHRVIVCLLHNVTMC